ncbi:hypothetical protein NFI96_005234 [Prochilodus magdalenae]|nr:hypothetical protein NFI96_005234 [Prochilodus magdalenae]
MAPERRREDGYRRRARHPNAAGKKATGCGHGTRTQAGTRLQAAGTAPERSREEGYRRRARHPNAGGNKATGCGHGIRAQPLAYRENTELQRKSTGNRKRRDAELNRKSTGGRKSRDTELQRKSTGGRKSRDTELQRKSTGSESALPTVTVKLHHPATLPCSERCPGVVRWTVFHKPTEVLAECDQTSCRSVKEGYQMIHDQYLKGNFSLTITDADLSKRARYTSRCGGVDLCDVALKVECVNTPLQIPAGGDLVLDLDVSDPVEVLYNSGGAAGPSRVQVCTGDGHRLQCRPEYTQRASAALKLRGVTPPDSGVYTIRDIRNEEDVRSYSVSVQEQPSMYEDQGPAVPAWIKVVLVVQVAAVILCAVFTDRSGPLAQLWVRTSVQQVKVDHFCKGQEQKGGEKEETVKVY